jgi:biotin operon repressor
MSKEFVALEKSIKLRKLRKSHKGSWVKNARIKCHCKGVAQGQSYKDVLEILKGTNSRNLITGNQIAKLLSLSPGHVRRQISMMRSNHGIPVVSTYRGYYLTESLYDIDKMIDKINKMIARNQDILATFEIARQEKLSSFVNKDAKNYYE